MLCKDGNGHSSPSRQLRINRIYKRLGVNNGLLKRFYSGIPKLPFVLLFPGLDIFVSKDGLRQPLSVHHVNICVMTP